MKETYGIAETMGAIQELMWGNDTYAARTRWGLVFQGNAPAPETTKMYPEFATWVAVWKKLNSAGLFVNEFHPADVRHALS